MTHQNSIGIRYSKQSSEVVSVLLASADPRIDRIDLVGVPILALKIFEKIVAASNDLYKLIWYDNKTAPESVHEHNIILFFLGRGGHG